MSEAHRAVRVPVDKLGAPQTRSSQWLVGKSSDVYHESVSRKNFEGVSSAPFMSSDFWLPSLSLSQPFNFVDYPSKE